MNGKQVSIIVGGAAVGLLFLVLGLADVGCEGRYRVAPAEGICGKGTDLRTTFYVLAAVVVVAAIIIALSPWGRRK